jgi:hypothetical protein
MNKRSVSVSVLVLTAVMALVIGSFGTATAAGLTKGKVKKIAAKVVGKAAPGLTVASAGNATNLAGKPASLYLDQFVQTDSTTSTAVATGTNTQILNPVAITVPSGVGFVHVTAVAGFAGGNANVAMWFQMDSVCLGSGSDWTNRQFGNTTPAQDSISVSRVVPVTPGVHTFRLCVANGAGVNADNRVLTVETVALAG